MDIVAVQSSANIVFPISVRFASRHLVEDRFVGRQLLVVQVGDGRRDQPVEPDPEPFDIERQRRIESELGDVLFVLANIARRWHINPEEALRNSNAKFQRRVEYIERRLKEQGQDIRTATLLEMEQYYQEGKRRERELPESTPSSEDRQTPG